GDEQGTAITAENWRPQLAAVSQCRTDGSLPRKIHGGILERIRAPTHRALDGLRLGKLHGCGQLHRRPQPNGRILPSQAGAQVSIYTYTFDDIQNRPVAVIGAGTLGRRIALMFASRGGTVRIHARRAEQSAAAIQFVTENLPKLLQDRGFGEAGRVTGTDSLEEALDGAWLAIESVPEKLEIKI